MDFACELMGLCRGTQEVEAILGEDTGGTYDPLARLRLAIQYEEKKVSLLVCIISFFLLTIRVNL